MLLVYGFVLVEEAGDGSLGLLCLPLLVRRLELALGDCRVRAANNIFALHTQEEAIILTKQGLLHDPIDLDHFKELTHVQVPIQLVDASI